jgi:iron complex outermembrane receptor protein
VRTASPKETPQSSINLSSGIYCDPQRPELKWWGNTNPIYTNATFFHSRRIKNLDLVFGGNVFSDEGYRKFETTQRARFNYNLRYRFQKVKGLTVGLSGNHMLTSGGLFILWAGADSAYLPQGGNLQLYKNYRTTIDPFAIYIGEKGWRHSIRTRFFRSNNTNDKNQESRADLYYAEYQLQKHFEKGLVLTTGSVFTFGDVHSDSLYGRHTSNNASVYIQADKKFGRLSVSAGARGEYFKVDTAETEFDVKMGGKTFKSPVYPVFRVGANYQLLEYTHLRASFGQGYRFPSVAEKYIETKVNGLTILPNPELKPENGWSAELGVKQGVKIGKWQGFADLAAFWTEYYNMIEFNFDYYFPDPNGPHSFSDYLTYFGAKSLNIGHTRITGIEPSITGTGKLGPIETTIMAGYTYIDPVNLNKDSKYVQTGTDTSSGILKYRFKHTAKADIELTYKKISMGWSVRYNSFMQNIDRRFEEPLLYDFLPSYKIYILPGLKEYREKNHHGDLVFDARLSCQASKMAKISLICNNVFNREYASRPGYIMPPRNIALQVVVKF